MKSEKRKIRLERAQRKLDKRVYPTDETERQTIKIIERNEQLEKDIQNTWKIMYSKGFKAGQDNQNPTFFQDFDFIHYAMEEKDKNRKKIDTLLKKLNVTEEKLMYDYNRMNTGRGSTSF